MANVHDYSVHMEYTIRSVFGFDERSEISFLTSGACITDNPFGVVMSTLMYLHGQGKLNKEDVEKFYDRFECLKGLGIDELLSFNSSNKVVRGIPYEIDYENGEDAIEAMSKAFSDICSQK